MMKKLLSLIAVSAALATAGCALVACGGSDDNHVVKTEVTKQQWSAAFAVDSFARNVKIYEISETVEGRDKTAQETTLMVGSKKYGDYSLELISYSGDVKDREANRIRIVTADGDNVYARSTYLAGDEWKDGEWHFNNKTHVEYDADEWSKDVLNSLGFTYILNFADKYDDFTYSDGEYVITDEEVVLHESISDDKKNNYYSLFRVTASNATLMFADSKLVSLEMTMKTVSENKVGDNPVRKREENGTCSVTITYGAQKIDK
ncbi:MAG: hypothetical protein K2L88_01045, partial [Clostridiales bacterium]|nr:hypothetical protein [Clostridiales bacterium]